ncbi:hypothetical protein SeLEV6574_g02483 [Synchytrium endobioticum]|uniref:Uncharacterized protein n=1 Tax=Synchytrium endobioticum TaxID=286115 RepID=A0A507D8S0_9FUNG|nr:hypothetical protein SeLEV6574_g02483 [Synchytrium endobioticum]
MPSTGVLKVSPKVVTFDDDQYQEPKEVPEAKAVKPSSKARAKRAPSGLSNRTKTADDANSLGPKTSKKNFSEATKVIASLSKRCGGYRTIHVGHLRGHIGNDQQETIARRINDAVGILNRARAIAERATEMLIDGICSSNQDTHLLLQLTHGGKGGANYWTNLLRMIVDGTLSKRVGSEHRPILEKVQALWGANFLRNLSWPDTDIKTLMITVLIQKVAADIDTVFSNQIVGMLPLLKERVVEVVGEEGKQAVEGIEAWVDESLEDDPPNPPPPVQVFYKINRSFQITVREVAGVGLNARKMVIRAALMKNPSKGRLLDEVFLLPPEMLAKSRYVLDDSPRRYVRTSSFKTNGLVLALLWIDTTSKSPPPDRKVEDAINFPNIFKNKTLQSTHQMAWIIAFDPGLIRKRWHQEAPNPPGSEESAQIRVDIGPSALPNVAQGTQVEIVFMDLAYSIDVPAPPTVAASQSPLARKNMILKMVNPIKVGVAALLIFVTFSQSAPTD